MSRAQLTDKIYYHHTGYIGGIKSIALEKLLKEHPERVIEIAVKACCEEHSRPKHVPQAPCVRGCRAPHQAQQPQPLEIQ